MERGKVMIRKLLRLRTVDGCRDSRYSCDEASGEESTTKSEGKSLESNFHHVYVAWHSLAFLFLFLVKLLFDPVIAS